MRRRCQLPLAWAALAVLSTAAPAHAAEAIALDTDPNADGLAFGATDAFTFGAAFSQDGAAVLNGNDVLVQKMYGIASGGAGAGISVPLSNGENGVDQSLDGLANSEINNDLPNETPPDDVFATIGNASGKLENGNVIRYSMWVRVDPNAPITKAPQIEPVLKFEFWKEALSTFADTAPGPQPYFGDKVFDTDQHFGEGVWIDLDNNGSVIDASAAAEGRIRSVSTTEWTLINVEYEVDDGQWLGIDDDVYTVEDIEEVRSAMFWGEFAGADLTNAGSLMFDNILVEVFADQAAADASPASATNPRPVPGPATIVLLGMAAAAMGK